MKRRQERVCEELFDEYVEFYYGSYISFNRKVANFEKLIEFKSCLEEYLDEFCLYEWNMDFYKKTFKDRFHQKILENIETLEEKYTA